MMQVLDLIRHYNLSTLTCVITLPPSSLGMNRYFSTFIDDYTRKSEGVDNVQEI